MALTNIAWVGRLTGPKGEIASRVIRDVAPRFPDISFTIVGGPVTDEYRQMAGKNVLLTDFVADVNQVFSENDLVIGAGRVPVEAMRFGLPVIAVGENRYIGPIDDDTIAKAKATNFGDCDQLQVWNVQQLIDDLQSLISGERVLPVNEYADYVSDYQLDSVYPQVMSVYRQALMDDYLQRFKEVPVLTYHRVLTAWPAGSKFNIYVTIDELDWQIKSLKQRGYEFVTFKDIANGIQVKKPVILTFDDGYEDNYLNLLPLLKQHNAKAVIYALADRALKNNAWDMAKGEPEAPLMSDEQLLACHASGLIEIGSHGKQHRPLSKLCDDDASVEIRESKRILESLLGDEVVSFAYPYGNYGERETLLVKQAGYLFGVATVSGPLKLADDFMRVRRITMFPGTKTGKFKHKTSGWYLRYCKLKGKDF
ncbi:polysaccharide deacetylase family protein [Pseudomonadota bacterium]